MSGKSDQIDVLYRLIFIKVIEDRVLEFYGQNISTQTSSNVDSQAPDVAQLELAAVLGEEQLEKVSKVVVTVSSLPHFNSWSVEKPFFLHHITSHYFTALLLLDIVQYWLSARKTKE